MENQKNQLEDSGSLETPENAGQSEVTPTPAATPTKPEEPAAPLATPESSAMAKPVAEKPSVFARLRKVFYRFNIYTIGFGLSLLLVAGITFYSVRSNHKSAVDSALNTQTLSIDDLKNLSSSDTSVGDPKQTLSIESNAIFAGKVLVRDGVDIAGSLSVGGTLTLKGVKVDGKSSLTNIQTEDLAVSGDASLQGKVNIQGSLTVNGSGTFNGSLSADSFTVNDLNLSGDLTLSHHITSTGSQPSRSNGSALGSGGTSSVSGSDVAGTVTINTGSSAPSGCFITVNFASAYATKPHVVISPVGSTAAGMNYYVNRSTSSFSVCTSSDPPDNNSNIVFDYIVVN